MRVSIRTDGTRCDDGCHPAQSPPSVDITAIGDIMASNDRSLLALPCGGVVYSRGASDPDVSMRCTRSGEWLVVEVAGELDLQAVPLLDALGGDPCLVVLDLHGVTFMDCSGIRALLEARRRAVAGGGAVHLAAPSRHVSDLLRLTDLGRAFPAFDSVSAAIAGLSGAGRGHTRPRLVRPRRSGGD